MNFFLTLIIFLTISIGYSSEICSRIAQINYQEVLVDAGDRKKGEGLRYYLEKDPVSKKLLNDYQRTNTPSKWSVASTTLGSVLILAGLFQTGDSDELGSKDTLILSGAGIIGINYLINKTISTGSEKILNKAIMQYNKRNSPKIFFNPLIEKNGAGASLSVTQEF